MTSLSSPPRLNRRCAMQKSEIKTLLTTWFEEAGLIFLGVVDLEITKDFEKFRNWLAEGLHANMEFLRNHLDVREHPEHILKGARSVFVFAYAYRGELDEVDPILQESELQWTGKIAKYARLRDYHKFMRDRCETIIARILSMPAYANESFRIAVDSAPVLERAFAKKTSHGFIGKNTCFIHPKIGSFILLGEIFSTIALASDEPAKIDHSQRTEEGGCGTCKRCQVHCPTGALDRDYILNAKKCISYWTIEHRGSIPTEIWPWLKEYVFGCDICQNVCPYNRRAPVSDQSTLERVAANIDLFYLATLTQEEYITKFAGTPVTRAKRHGLRRNALIAMYENKDSRLKEAMAFAAQDSHLDIDATIAQIRELESSGNASQ